MAQGLPAHDAFAERVVCSAAVLDPCAIPELARFLTPEDFYLVPCREIWRAAVELDEAGREVAMDAVASWLDERGKLAGIGGAAAIAEIVDATPAVAAAHEYARSVAERAAVRRTVEVGARFVAEGRSTVEDPRGWLGDVAARVAEVTDLGRLSERDPAATARVVAGEVLDSVTDRIAKAKAGEEGAPGLSTGFRGLDYRIGRLAIGSMTILGAATGIGKTGLALRIARNVARAGLAQRGVDGVAFGVAYATLEIPRAELLERALADCSHVDCDALFSGTVADSEQPAITAALADLAKLPLVIDDGTAHSIATLRGLVRRAATKLGCPIRLLVVDYLQLVRVMARRGASQEEVVAEVSKGLRALAGDLGVAVLATSQFNRDFKNRSDKEPVITDLRHSGQLEQDARAIILLHRDSPEDAEMQSVWAIVPKARGGGHVGRVRLLHRKRTATWAEEAREDDPTEPLGRSGYHRPRPPPRPFHEPAEPDDFGISDGFGGL